MPRKRKHLDKDAKVQVSSKYLHPSILIQSTLPNLQSNHRLENCAVVKRETRKVNCRQQVVVVLYHMTSRPTVTSLKKSMLSNLGAK